MKTLYLFLLTIILAGCNSNDSAESLVQNSEDILIKREVLTKANGELSTAEFNYDGNKLTSLTSSDGYSLNYFYEGELLSRVDILESGSVIIYVEIEYSENLISQYTAYFINGLVERFEFNHVSNESILVKRYSGDSNSQEFQNDIEVELLNENIERVSFTDYTLEYQYDNNNCPYQNIHSIKELNLIGLDFGGFEGVTNNPISRIEVDSGDTENQIYNHTYDSLGFPSFTEITLNGEPYGEIEYFYE